ncbi:MAG: glycosyl hydrolase [Gemmatimonadota bacterium]|nr:glycosyl hydrolase [Gemmatimonadota bacterium]
MKASRTAPLLLALTALTLIPSAARAQMSLEDAVANLEYREVGPALMGGRITSLAVVEAKPQVFYLGTATGGLWKTENHGTSWTPLFDDQPTSSIGAVAIDQANPNLVWVGTGEPQNRQSSPWGNGVYKSTDGGKTWSHMGLDATRHIGRVLINPRNPDVVWVAAVGDLWGPNPERGVYKTTDGGATWDLVLYIDEDTGAIELAMDPADPNTVFAAMYQRRRTGWGFNGGGPGSGLYRTLDGGANWTELTEGLPEGDKGRIGVTVYRQNGNMVYALIEADARDPSAGFGGFGGGGGDRETGLYRSLDRGATWEKISDTNPRPMYYSQVRVDPSNPDRVYVLGTQLAVSDDGGRTFRNDGAEQIHVDHHDLWINPNDSDHLIIGSDGGVSATWDGTAHWRMFDNIALGQFYAIGYDMSTPYKVCGGLQDNDAWCGPSNTLSFHGIRNQDWYETAYGDGFFTIVDPSDSTIVYSESQGGNMNRYDLRTGEKTPMRPIEGPRAEGDTTKDYRYNWNSPLQLSPHDPATVYLGANYLLRSRDRGMTWEEVGGLDLTKQIDRDTLSIMGVRGDEAAMSPHDGISTYGNLTSVAESPVTRGVIYVGTDDGNLQVSRDDGATWTNVADRIPGLPPRTYVSRVEPSHHVAGRVYASFDGHRNGDFAPYAYVSEDYGQSWSPIANGLPDLWSVNVIVEHHRTPNLLFIGNEVGVYASIDRGASWTMLKNNLPTVPVDDILIHPRDNDLIVGTHGRSIWIMADVAPLERLATGMMADAGGVMGSRSIMFAERGDWPFYGARYSAPNPPRGARIRYWLRDAPGDTEMATGGDGGAQEEVSLTITDTSGEHVRTLDTEDTPGIHEIIWDWRHDAPYEPARGGGGPGGGGGGFGGGGTPSGPVVLPGTYTVTLAVGGQTYSDEIEVIADPRRPIPMDDRVARQDALMSLHALAKPIYDAGQAANALDEQLEAANDLVEAAANAPEDLTAEIEAIEEELEAIRDDLGDARRNAGVSRAIEQSSTIPTADHLWQVDEAWRLMPDILDRLNALITDRVPALNARLHVEALRPEVGERIELPVRPDM